MFLFLFELYIVQNDVFTSNFRMCEILHFELEQIGTFERYFENDTENKVIINKFEKIRTYIPKSYFPINLSIEECIDENSILSRFASHPINAFHLLNRFKYDWPFLQKALNKCNGPFQFDSFKSVYKSSEFEISQIYLSFIRFQKYYDILPRDIVRGYYTPSLKHIVQSYTIVPQPLKPRDIFHIGQNAYNMGDYDSSVDYLYQAYEMIKKLPDKEFIHEICDYLSWSLYQIGNTDEAIKYASIMLKINNNNPRIEANIILFKRSKILGNITNRINLKREVKKILTTPSRFEELKKAFKSYEELDEEYEMLESEISKMVCKADRLWKQDKHNMKHNICYIKRGNNIIGKFQYVKIEKIYHDPDIIIFRNLLEDDDMKHLKIKAKNILENARVLNRQTNLSETSQIRITQTAWLELSDDPIMKKLLMKIKIGTGLKLSSVENLQIANYGITGFYYIHYDFALKINSSNNINIFNNRMATVMIYISDVVIGGRTGFPRLGISVKPSKGDAIFWYNLHPDTTGDARVSHVACPVLLGTKWVSNFWIRMFGEDVSRPCNLNQQNGI